MTVSYRQLIGEHDAMDHVAAALLADARNGDTAAAGLAGGLAELANLVRDHLAVEDAIVDGFDPHRLSGPWVEAWAEAEANFARLRADWLGFVATWQEDAISRDRPGFQVEAEAMLGRLRARLDLETRAFYATALQAGAITLR